MLRSLASACGSLVLFLAVPACAQAVAHVEPFELKGPRPLDEQTRAAVVRDYLDAWRSMSAALGGNRADRIDAAFVGDAKDKLNGTILQQTMLRVSTNYHDQSHDLRIVFYSPDGLSIEMTDDSEYELQVFDQGRPVATQQIRAHYIVVLTPAETRWKVRVLQAAAE